MKTYINYILIILLISCNNNKFSFEKTNSMQGNYVNSVNNVDSNNKNIKNNSFDNLKNEFVDKDSTNKHENINYQCNNEDFNSFFKRFKTDITFQRERILYPLLIIIEDEYEPESYYDNKIVFLFEDSLNSNEVIYTLKQINSFCFEVIIQIDNTGMNQVFVFKLDKNKWYLYQLIDRST